MTIVYQLGLIQDNLFTWPNDLLSWKICVLSCSILLWAELPASADLVQVAEALSQVKSSAVPSDSGL